MPIEAADGGRNPSGPGKTRYGFIILKCTSLVSVMAIKKKTYPYTRRD